MLYAVFQENFIDLKNAIDMCPEEIAGKLFSRSLIPSSVLHEVITSEGLKKSGALLLKLSILLKSNPERLHDLIAVLKEEKVFDDITKKLIGKKL